MRGNSCCAGRFLALGLRLVLHLGQVGGQVIGEPAVAGPEGLGLCRLGVPVMVGSPVAGMLGCLTTSLGAVIVGVLAGVWAERRGKVGTRRPSAIRCIAGCCYCWDAGVLYMERPAICPGSN